VGGKRSRESCAGEKNSANELKRGPPGTNAMLVTRGFWGTTERGLQTVETRKENEIRKAGKAKPPQGNGSLGGGGKMVLLVRVKALSIFHSGKNGRNPRAPRGWTKKRSTQGRESKEKIGTRPWATLRAKRTSHKKKSGQTSMTEVARPTRRKGKAP